MKNLQPDDFVNEDELLDFLNASSRQVASLRSRGMPYLQIGNNLRMYYIPKVLEWMITKSRNG
jgi:phage terminase Nu1 subunit (DNA packaging protein)